MRLLVFMLAAFGLAGQPSFYRFAVDQDSLAGAPDFSYLNHPIGPEDRTFVRDGHFFRVGADLAPFTGDDERVRFFGVNLAFGANFPEEADAARLARRLRKLGVNLVRLHHMDSSPDSSPANANSLLMAARYPALNSVAVRRMRTFLDALKAEGIYCNLNLHVGYTFDPKRDNMPGPVPSQSKPLHMIWQAMVEAQQAYTRAVVDALGLRDDPVLAMAEINNESSLLQAWQWGELDSALSGEYSVAFKARWNRWLSDRYANTDALRAAWSGEQPDGPELLPGAWKLEVHSPSQATIESGAEQTMVRVLKGGAPVIAKQVGFSIEAGASYRVEVELRADLPAGQSRAVYWDVKQDVSPWNTETSRTIQVTNQWQSFSLTFTAAFPMEAIGRFGLSVESVEVPVSIRNCRLYRSGKHGLAADESLETAGISLVRADEAAREPRINDYLLFLADRDRDYLNAMLSTVREVTRELLPVAGTQMGYGGLMNFDSHEALDYQDHHYYVDHYSFPNTQWDGRDWRFRDVSSVGTGMAEILNVAAARQAGVPYTVSEFNQPWPNTYAAESDLTLAIVGAFQDWDSIMHFAYSHGRTWDAGVPNGFNINGDWSKWVNLGQSAWLFRSGALSAGKEPLEIPVSLQLRLQATREKRNGNIAAFLNRAAGYDAALALEHPVKLARDSEAAMPPLGTESGLHHADSGEFTYDRPNRLFLIHSPLAAGVVGFPNGTATAGSIDLELAAGARGFVALLVTPLDGKPVGESERLLVSNPGYTLRSQPGADPARPQAIVNYGAAIDWWTLERDLPAKPSGDLNGGVGPTWMERVEAALTLRSRVTGLVVYPLDGSGRRLAPLTSDDLETADGTYRIRLRADSPWYEIAKEQ